MVSGTYFKVDDGRFPARPVDLIQEIARRPMGHTVVVGVTLIPAAVCIS